MLKQPTDIFKLYDIGSDDECWVYLGNAWGGSARDQRPYFQAAGRRQITYRWVYELVHGVTLTPDQIILHSCDQGGYPIACANPAHMRIGTHQNNMDDMNQRSRHGLPRIVVRAIQKLLDEGRTQQEIADMYGVTREAVRNIGLQITRLSKDRS